MRVLASGFEESGEGCGSSAWWLCRAAGPRGPAEAVVEWRRRRGWLRRWRRRWRARAGAAARASAGAAAGVVLAAAAVSGVVALVAAAWLAAALALWRAALAVAGASA